MFYTCILLPPHSTPTQDTQLQTHTKIHFKRCKQLPIRMSDAQAVIYRGRLYVGGGETPTGDSNFTICIYNFTPDTWDTIKGPARLTALAVYQGHLVLAGGIPPTSYVSTNRLWLTNSDQHTWKQTIPPMPTPTLAATAIATDKHLIISGGISDDYLDIVQVYNGTQWALAHPLPTHCCFIQSTYHNDTYYLIGGHGKQVFSTSLHSLIQSAYQTKTTDATPPTVWNTLDTPYQSFSIAVLRSELVAIGGEDYSITPSLRIYSHQHHTWETMYSALPQPLYRTCSITLPTGELMVIGGEESDGQSSAQVYKGSVSE